MTTGELLRDQGIADVLAADSAPHRGYADLVDAAIAHFTAADIPFSAEDVRDHIEREHPEAVAHSPNVLPGCFGRASRAGLIVPVGVTKPTRATRHGNRNLVWKATA